MGAFSSTASSPRGGDTHKAGSGFPSQRDYEIRAQGHQKGKKGIPLLRGSECAGAERVLSEFESAWGNIPGDWPEAGVTSPLFQAERASTISFQAGDTRVFEQAECKPELARECTCDTLHPEGFVPTNATLLRRGVAASAGSQPHIFPGVGREAGLECDKEMMHQMAKSGTDSHSRATWAGTRRLDRPPKLFSKAKWQLALDDSIAAEGTASCNSSAADEALLDSATHPCSPCERVVLWAVNSTYAYHMLTVAPQELTAGVAVSAYLTFVLAVASFKIDEYYRLHP
ncbi:MAG: hypothetical protein SGPRY_006090 [Prymnesium sp.]